MSRSQKTSQPYNDTFDIRQLRYAIAAADHGSFYRAARALDVEQSTLSRNIIGLECIVGAKLFDRSRAGVTPTACAVPCAGATPVIPGRCNRKRAIRYDKQRSCGRHLIENAFCRLKDFRRVATRYDKLAANFLSAVALATAVAFWL